jgi:hypothetical protein
MDLPQLLLNLFNFISRAGKAMATENEVSILLIPDLKALLSAVHSLCKF